MGRWAKAVGDGPGCKTFFPAPVWRWRTCGRAPKDLWWKRTYPNIRCSAASTCPPSLPSSASTGWPHGPAAKCWQAGKTKHAPPLRSASSERVAPWPTRPTLVIRFFNHGETQRFSAFCRSTPCPVVRMIGMSSTIKSDRLDLVTFSPSFLRASLDGDLYQAETILELSLPAGWSVCDAGLHLRNTNHPRQCPQAKNILMKCSPNLWLIRARSCVFPPPFSESEIP